MLDPKQIKFKYIFCSIIILSTNCIVKKNEKKKNCIARCKTLILKIYKILYYTDILEKYGFVKKKKTKENLYQNP